MQLCVCVCVMKGAPVSCRRHVGHRDGVCSHVAIKNISQRCAPRGEQARGASRVSNFPGGPRRVRATAARLVERESVSPLPELPEAALDDGKPPREKRGPTASDRNARHGATLHRATRPLTLGQRRSSGARAARFHTRSRPRIPSRRPPRRRRRK